MEKMKCFICSVDFVPIEKYLGSHIDGAMATMRLIDVLEKSLHIVADIENEYFCIKCVHKIEEYDELVQQIHRIENDLFALFQTKSEIFVLNLKCELEEQEFTENQIEVNEVHITKEQIQSEVDDDEELLVDSKFNIVEFKTTTKPAAVRTKSNRARKSKTDSQEKCKSNSKKGDNNNVEDVKNKSTGSKLVKKKHYKIEQVSCDICGRTYMSKGALGVHLVKHSSNNPHGKMF